LDHPGGRQGVLPHVYLLDKSSEALWADGLRSPTGARSLVPRQWRPHWQAGVSLSFIFYFPISTPQHEKESKKKNKIMQGTLRVRVSGLCRLCVFCA
jgi:hypothetical protein